MYKKILNTGLLFLMVCTLAACGSIRQQDTGAPNASEDGSYVHTLFGMQASRPASAFSCLPGS